MSARWNKWGWNGTIGWARKRAGLEATGFKEQCSGSMDQTIKGVWDQGAAD